MTAISRFLFLLLCCFQKPSLAFVSPQPWLSLKQQRFDGVGDVVAVRPSSARGLCNAGIYSHPTKLLALINADDLTRLPEIIVGGSGQVLRSALQFGIVGVFVILVGFMVWFGITVDDFVENSSPSLEDFVRDEHPNVLREFQEKFEEELQEEVPTEEMYQFLEDRLKDQLERENNERILSKETFLWEEFKDEIEKEDMEIKRAFTIYGLEMQENFVKNIFENLGINMEFLETKGQSKTDR